MQDQIIPDNSQGTTLTFLELFLERRYWKLLYEQQNPKTMQVKELKLVSYLAKNMLLLKYSLDFSMLQIEKCMIKPWYQLGEEQCSLYSLVTTARDYGGRQWCEAGRKWQHCLLSHRELSRRPITVCISIRLTLGNTSTFPSFQVKPACLNMQSPCLNCRVLLRSPMDPHKT